VEIVNPRDLGLYVRQRRQDNRYSQERLARAAGVSRRWLSDLEAGKPTAEIGLVLNTLHALGVVFDAVPSEEYHADRLDLDDVLGLTRRPSNG
jgi:HTH-type transcriptional regulator / antitoxin HipB